MWWAIWVVRRNERHESDGTMLMMFGVKEAFLCCYEYPCVLKLRVWLKDLSTLHRIQAELVLVFWYDIKPGYLNKTPSLTSINVSAACSLFTLTSASFSQYEGIRVYWASEVHFVFLYPCSDLCLIDDCLGAASLLMLQNIHGL